MLGSPALARSFLSWWYALLGFRGASGQMGSWKIHGEKDLYFRFRSSSAVLGGRTIFRVPAYD